MQYYFALLGLPTTATVEDVKKAYRRMAKQYHPDVNPDPQAVAHFQEIGRAYEYLLGYLNGSPQTRYAPYPYQGYPPYYGQGTYPPYGQAPYSTQQDSPSQEDNAFKSYAWESWDPETLRREAVQRRKQPPVQKAPPPPPPPVVPQFRRDLLELAQEEASAESKIRAKGGRRSVEEQLNYDIAQYLKQGRYNTPPEKERAPSVPTTTQIHKTDRSVLGYFFRYDTKGRK